jgi:catechol 2,3-dioxygenase-like lactoylglutathione lyase family enzyme
LNNLSERYEHLKSLVTERRSEFDRLCSFAENETEYLTAPASTRFHLCKEGGLLEHSINVCETMLKIKDTLAPEISDESCVVTALFHDLGKVGMPNNPMYIKNAGKGGKEASIPYSFNNQMTYMSVPLRSLYFILPLFPLTPNETQAIITGLHHISMKCHKGNEYKKVVAFYTEVLGLNIVRTWGEAEPDGIMFDTGNGLIEIFVNSDSEPELGIIRHFALSTDDVDSCVEAIKKAGYEVFVEPKNIVIPSEPPFNARIAFFYGPLGEQIELFQEMRSNNDGI